MLELTATELKKLKQEFVEKRRQNYDGAVIDAAAHVLLEVGNPDQMLQVAIDFLARQLSPCRIDAGIGSPHEMVWRPEVAWLSSTDGVPTTLGLSLPNSDPLVQRVWKSTTPVLYQDFDSQPSLRSLADTFAAVGTKSMMAQRLEFAGQRLGILCVDQTTHTRRWQPEEQQLVHTFCKEFLSPLLYRCRQQSASLLKAPSKAEIEAIRLAAEGLSYKQIAKHLNKSVRTIEHQLRSARNKLQAKNQTDLVRKCLSWL